MNRVVACTLALGAALGAMSSGGCSDPVRTSQIEALGPDTEPPNPDHRPGQPCVLCHSEGGPAEGKAFAMAGTIYENAKVDAKGAAEVIVQFVDANGTSPVGEIGTGPTGNFFVPLSDWPELAFPVKVAIYDNATSAPIQVMRSLIGREPSCNFCHRPNVDPKKAEDEDTAIDFSRSSAGQIYVGLQ